MQSLSLEAGSGTRSCVDLRLELWNWGMSRTRSSMRPTEKVVSGSRLGRLSLFAVATPSAPEFEKEGKCSKRVEKKRVLGENLKESFLL